ncbi:MAG: twin-arginine translocase subunit TatC [Sporomusaceae bacterium]|nr:twin-arginine translocase subunit TatC [Sporomusaceae bacterium]
MEPSDAEMALVDHLQELRTRLIAALVVLAAASAVCYYYVDAIMRWLLLPVGKLYYINPAEAFLTYCKVAMAAGLFVCAPFILYQFWAFVIPALTARERAAVAFFAPVSIVLFYGGAAFAYFFIMPAAVAFFISFANESLQPMISVGQYVSLVLSLLLPFGLVFELPLLVAALARAGLVSAGALASRRKYAIVAAFVIGGIVSPTPDVFGQIMLAVPVMLLYECSIWIARCCFPRKQQP